MSIVRKIAYNAIVNAVAKVSSTVLSLVSIGFITRYLGKDGFGDYATILAFFSFFIAIADLGLYTIATREISRKDADEKKIMGNVFGMRIVTSLFVAIVAPLFIFFLPYSPDVKMGIMVIVFASIFSSNYIVLNGVFQKNLVMDRVAITEFIGRVIQLGIVIYAVQNNHGLIAIVSALLFYMVFNFIIVFTLSRKYCTFRIQFDLSYWKEFLKHSWPMGIATIISFLYLKIDTILLSILQESSDVGIYNVAYKIIENLVFFPAMLMGLILPLMSRYIFTDKKKFIKIVNTTLKVFMLAILPIVVGVLFLADDIVAIIGGDGFPESANVLRILIFTLFFIFFGQIFTNVLLVGNLQKRMMILLGFCAVFNISVNAIVIPLWSYTGAAVVSVFTEGLVVTLTVITAITMLKYKPRVEGLVRIMSATAVMGLFLYAAHSLPFIFEFIGAVIVYIIFLFLTRAITQSEISSIIKPHTQTV